MLCAVLIVGIIVMDKHGSARVPGGPRGLQIRCVATTVVIGGFDSHTFPLHGING
jgi:hypothetical protein